MTGRQCGPEPGTAPADIGVTGAESCALRVVLSRKKRVMSISFLQSPVDVLIGNFD